jgi:hypothetical protein
LAKLIKEEKEGIKLAQEELLELQTIRCEREEEIEIYKKYASVQVKKLT